MDNANTKDYLDKIRNQVVENLKRTAFAPSVQMTDVPRNPLVDGMDDEADDVLDDLDEDENKDKRFTQRRFDQYVEKAGELSDSEDEDVKAANGVRRQPNATRRRNHANYRNLDADSGLDSGMATPQEASSVGDGDLDPGLDAKMVDAPRTEPDTSVAATALNDQSTITLDADRMVVDEEKAPSAAITHQPSHATRDEDTTMEDASAPALEAGQTEPVFEAKEEIMPTILSSADNASEVPRSPPPAQSPPKAASSNTVDKGEEIATLESPPAEMSETTKAASAESPSESTKKEE